MIFQIFLVLFALFALAKTVKQYKKQRASKYWLSIWTMFWGLVIFVAFLPHLIDKVANFVGVERGADMMVYIAVVILSYGMYRMVVKIEKMDRDFTQLVRKIAKENPSKDKVKK